MNILEVSYGCPSEKYPLNGIFQMDQAKALVNNGHNVVFAAIDVRSIRKWRRWGISMHTEEGIPVVEFNFPWGPFLSKIREAIGEFGFSLIMRIIVAKYWKPDIVHVHFGETASCVMAACKRENIPYVITEHSSGINRDDFEKSEIISSIRAYQNAASVIAVSNILAKRIERYSGIKSAVIPNIIDFGAFSLKKDHHEVYQFISAGSLVRGKGFDVTIKAFGKIIEKGIDARLLIMGDGPERNNLLELVHSNKINDKVFFFGSYTRSQFAEELSKSDCFVLASRGETFGVVYAEALACGVPVIATRCGGPEDFIDATNGLLIDVDDTAGLVEVMGKMYNSADKYDPEHISSNIRLICSSHNVAEKITGVFDKVIEKNRSQFALINDKA